MITTILTAIAIFVAIFTLFISAVIFFAFYDVSPIEKVGATEDERDYERYPIDIPF